jgi:hypothetical protein
MAVAARDGISQCRGAISHYVGSLGSFAYTVKTLVIFVVATW